MKPEPAPADLHRIPDATVGMPVRRIREDRILHEANATRGDVRRLCDLFGLSIKGAERYTSNTGRLLRVTRYEHVASLS
jgi:hypothetical protein